MPPVLFWKALAAFLVCPGTVAFAVPLLLLAPEDGLRSFRPAGLVPLAAGTALLLWCVQRFYVAGRGTLAPWSPPSRLVESGPYRYSRNPMYVAVALILGGWWAGFGGWILLAYLLAVSAAFHLRVVFGEEPWLARTHGAAWDRYEARVPRWVGFGRR
jgi:protein-S-isoprenylcysteine O-methyltransferase Ste14